jgi:hypothetical protein
VMRRGSPLCIAQRDRLSQRDSDAPAKASTQSVRYVVVASYRGTTAPAGYRDVNEGEVVCIDRDLRVTQHGL